MVLVAVASKAAFVTEVDSSANMMSVKVMPTNDLTKVPVRVSLANALPFTCVQCFITTPDSTDTFLYLNDEDRNSSSQDSTEKLRRKSVAYTPTERWAKSHTPMLSWDTKSCPGTMMILIASPKNENFAGNEGPLITLYFDATALTDGDYYVKMVGANMAWTDNRNIKAFYSPDMEAKFAIKDGKLITAD